MTARDTPHFLASASSAWLSSPLRSPACNSAWHSSHAAQLPSEPWPGSSRISWARYIHAAGRSQSQKSQPRCSGMTLAPVDQLGGVAHHFLGRNDTVELPADAFVHQIVAQLITQIFLHGEPSPAVAHVERLRQRAHAPLAGGEAAGL